MIFESFRIKLVNFKMVKRSDDFSSFKIDCLIEVPKFDTHFGSIFNFGEQK